MKSENSGEELPAGNVEETHLRDETQHAVNPSRLDPYKNFNFRIKWDGRVVAGISKVSALKRTTQVVEHREGRDPNSIGKSPGITKYETVTLERGITHDLEFEKWANKVWNFNPGNEASLKNFRKDIILEVLNEKDRSY